MVSHRLSLYHLKRGHIIRGSECRFWDHKPCLMGFFEGAYEGYGSGQGLGRCVICLEMPLLSLARAINFLGTALILLCWTLHFRQHSSWLCPRWLMACEVLQQCMKFFKRWPWLGLNKPQIIINHYYTYIYVVYKYIFIYNINIYNYIYK